MDASAPRCPACSQPAHPLLPVDVRPGAAGTPLADACREGHQGLAKLLISYRAELLFDPSYASSTLCEFAKKGDVERIKLLLAAGCDATAADYDLRTGLHLACSEGNALIAEALVHSGAQLNAIDRWGSTPLADAVREGHHKVAQTMYSKGGRLMLDESMTARNLLEYTRNGDAERVSSLLNSSANPNARDYDGRTALHLACSEGNALVVNELISHKCTPNLADRWGNTPLYDAVRGGHEVISRQGSHSAPHAALTPPHPCAPFSRWHVHWACAWVCVLQVIAKALLQNGSFLQLEESVVSGELCERARNGDVERIKLLIKSKCDANAADYDARTCLHLAASEGNLQVIRELITRGVNINATDR